jgi:hypothetical protein
MAFEKHGMMLDGGWAFGGVFLCIFVLDVYCCCWERQKSWMDHTWRLALGFFLSGFDAALAGGWL